MNCELASTVGKIISIQLVTGNIALMMTRYAHLDICDRFSWDSYFKLSEGVLSELKFWYENIDNYKLRPFRVESNCTRIVYSDASSSACGGFTVGVQNSTVHRTWSEEEKLKSSAWRELMGIKTVLISTLHVLEGHTIKWYTDNKAVEAILEKGSMKRDLQEIALDIYQICNDNNVKIEGVWIPRSLNDKADYISKIYDRDDWSISQFCFDKLNAMWGPFTMDRFASFHNKKVVRFNSRFWTPGSLGVDAFAFDWSADNNWLVPPISLVAKAIKHMIFCRARGVLVVPLWRSSAFWPLLVNGDFVFKNFVRQHFIFDNVPGLFVKGSVKSIFDENFKGKVIALKLDMR